MGWKQKRKWRRERKEGREGEREGGEKEERQWWDMIWLEFGLRTSVRGAGRFGGCIGGVGRSPSNGNHAAVHLTVTSQPSRLLFGWAEWRNTILLKQKKSFKVESNTIWSYYRALFTLMTHSLWLLQRQEVKPVTLKMSAKYRSSLKAWFFKWTPVCVCVCVCRWREREWKWKVKVAQSCPTI